jgi:short-subunit dehydrogenase
MLIIGNKDYGLAGSLYKLYPEAEFLSRTTGYNINVQNSAVAEQIAQMSLQHDVVIMCSALARFVPTMLCEKLVKTWFEKKHSVYLIAVGSSADTPLKGTSNLYPVEKRALRSYMRQLSQIASGDNSQGVKTTYIAPGNMHTPRQDEKQPGIPKLDTDYVAGVIKWLIDQPRNVNISELCLDRIPVD